MIVLATAHIGVARLSSCLTDVGQGSKRLTPMIGLGFRVLGLGFRV